MRIIFTGGAHLDPYYIERFAEYGVEVLEGYGMSECSPVISNNTPENHKKGSIGKPLENAEIRFENGEILVKGSSVMKGYYQMPAAKGAAVIVVEKPVNVPDTVTVIRVKNVSAKQEYRRVLHNFQRYR